MICFQDAAVECDVFLYDALGTEAVLGTFFACCSHAGAERFVLGEAHDSGGEAGDVADFVEVSRFALHDDLGNAARVRGENRMAEVHGFEDTQAKRLSLGGVDADIRGYEVVLDVEDVFPHDQAIRYAQFAHCLFIRSEAGSGDDEELGIGPRWQGSHDLEQIGDALDRAEVGDVDEEERVIVQA